MKTSPEISSLDIDKIRAQFPILSRMVGEKPLIYLDNAATAQKPQQVIDALCNYYGGYNANIHRGIHTLAEEATSAFEATRDTVKGLLGADNREEIIFTKGTTESINLVAATWGEKHIHSGDEIIISEMEHHSNIVPWQILCEKKGATLLVIPVSDEGDLRMDIFHQLLSRRTKLVAVTHISNALGTINPIEEIISGAHAHGALVLVDGAQSSVHLEVDVQKLKCDFFVCSAHKIYGPTGIGILYGKKALLNTMPVYHGGGEMIREVSFEKTTFQDAPYRFEAGTPNIADVIAFKPAIEFLEKTGKEAIRQHENQLLHYATDLLQTIPGLEIMGTTRQKAGVISFIIKGIHHQDVGILLDRQGIAVRTGHHCAQPLMKRFEIPGTIRASFAAYNTFGEIDALITGLEKAIRMLR